MTDRRIKLLSSNIQAGSITRAYSEYVTRSWSHVFPNGKRGNLDALAQTYQRQGAWADMHRVLSQAVRLSPNSFQRRARSTKDMAIALRSVWPKTSP